MTDAPVRTAVRTDDGWLEFQEYFVHRHQEPTVHEVRFDGIDGRPADRPRSRRRSATAAGDPRRAVEPDRVDRPDPRRARACARRSPARAGARRARSSAVSGIVGGRALKGPADRMLVSLGHEASALGVARLYRGLVDGFVLDTLDADLAPAVEALGLAVLVTDTVMTDDAARARLASEMLAFAERLRRPS